MENDYKRNYFWIKRDLKGNRHYYFKIKGTMRYRKKYIKLVTIHLKKKNVKKKREVSLKYPV